MSYELQAIVPRDRLPTREVWQAAIRAEKFDVVLHETLDWKTTSGFFPCRYDGKDAGFEIYRSVREEILHNYPALEKKMAKEDVAIIFILRGDAHEAASAVIACAVLVKMLSGFWFDPQSGEIVEFKDVVNKARRDVAALKRI